MRLVEDIHLMNEAFTYVKNFKKKFTTNCYISSDKFQKIIKQKKIFEIAVDDVVYFLKKEKNFSNLYYYAASIESLSRTLPILLESLKGQTVIVEIVSRTKLSIEKEIFEANKFNSYTSLLRMSSINRITDNYQLNARNIRSASIDESKEIFNLLIKYFDPMAEQLPDMEDIINWIKKENIIVFDQNKTIVGFIIYDLMPKTLFLRYWFVDPLFRNLKIGSQLFKEFLLRGGRTERQILWVIQTNENAIKRYLHYGFKVEDMFNYVLINNHLKYGIKSS